MSVENFNLQAPIVQSGIDAAWRLQLVNLKHERHYPAHIEAVFVLSGPGTYYTRLKPKEDELMRWMDRDRIRAGMAVMSEVTASKMREQKIIEDTKHFQVDKDDIAAYGPLFVYNGTPAENSAFERAVFSEPSRVKPWRIVGIRKVVEAGQAIGIRHTGDQVKSFYQEVNNPYSQLFDVRTIAVVQHESDFGRTLHYFKKHNDEREEAGLSRIEIWPYAVRNRPGTFVPLLYEELVKLQGYFEKGHVANMAEAFKI